MTPDTALAALGLAIGLLVGIVGHELAHAIAADRLGDPTPRQAGRITLNPKAHADPLGTIVLPVIFTLSVLVGRPLGIFFGWAKPVPTNPFRLRRPRDHRVLVAVAGPLTNLAIVVVAGLGFRVTFATPPGGSLPAVLYEVLLVNAFLFVLNVLPIPPLDGSKVLARFLSPQAAMSYEQLGQYGPLFLLLFLMIPQLGSILIGLVEPVVKIATGIH